MLTFDQASSPNGLPADFRQHCLPFLFQQGPGSIHIENIKIHPMITKEITIRNSSIGTLLLTEIQSKAEELDITGTMKIDKQRTITLIVSGKRNDLKHYITWCEATVTGHGATIAAIRSQAFKAFYNFSRV